MLEFIAPENLPKSLGGQCVCPQGCENSNAGPWLEVRERNGVEWARRGPFRNHEAEYANGHMLGQEDVKDDTKIEPESASPTLVAEPELLTPKSTSSTAGAPEVSQDTAVSKDDLSHDTEGLQPPAENSDPALANSNNAEPTSTSKTNTDQPAMDAAVTASTAPGNKASPTHSPEPLTATTSDHPTESSSSSWTASVVRILPSAAIPAFVANVGGPATAPELAPSELSFTVSHKDPTSVQSTTDNLAVDEVAAESSSPGHPEPANPSADHVSPSSSWTSSLARMLPNAITPAFMADAVEPTTVANGHIPELANDVKAASVDTTSEPSGPTSRDGLEPIGPTVKVMTDHGVTRQLAAPSRNS